MSVAPHFLECLLNLRCEQREAWQSGQQVLVETYLQRHPELSSEEDCVLDFIYSEYCLREELGAKPHPSEYMDRFPRWADSLQRLFDLHVAIAFSAPAPAGDANHRPILRVDRQAAESEAIDEKQRFEIRRPLDRGGLGIISVALDKDLHREVAIKEIRRELADDRDYQAKFALEALITGGLEHPGIVPVYGFGTNAEGRPFYAMRLIDGNNLLTHIRNFHERVNLGKEAFGGSSLRKLLRRFIDVCHAIDYAHARGVLHRDLKPSNIMLGKHGETLVVDWGFAKTMGDLNRVNHSSAADSPLEPLQVPHSFTPHRTAQEASYGTAAYASPEQLAGNLGHVTERSDVYGLGAILYESLTGQPPVLGKTHCAVTTNALMHPIALPRSINSSVPKPLEAICMRAMAKRPNERYASAAELRQEIECWLDNLPVQAFPETLFYRARRWMLAHPALMATAIVIVLMATIGLGLNSATVNRTNARLAELNAELEKQKNEAIVQEALAITSLAEQKELSTENSKILFQFGLAEYNKGNLSSSIWHLARSLRSFNDDERLSESYRNIFFDRLSQHGTTWNTLWHSDKIRSICFSPDGSRVATASDDKTVRLWDARTGLPICDPLKHQNNVVCIAFSPDGHRLASGSRDFTARLWDANSGTPLGEPMRHKSGIRSVAFSPDGNRMATASNDATARLWDGKTGTPIGAPMRHKRGVYCVAFSPSGNHLATASFDHTARLWNAHTAASLGKPMHHDDEVYCVAFSPDGNRIATASRDATARLWDARTGEPIGKPMDHEQQVKTVNFSPDSRRVVTASLDTTAHLWDGLTGESLGETMQHSGAVFSAIFSPDSDLIATVSGDKTARLWNGRSGAPVGDLMYHDSPVVTVDFSSDGTRLATASHDGAARLWEMRSGGLLKKTLEHTRNVVSVTYSQDGTFLATASDDKTARLWDAKTLEPLGKTMKHNYRILDVAISPDAKRIATASYDNTARLWDAQSGAALGEPMRHKSDVFSVSFSSDGNRLATASGDRTARLWDGHTGAPLGMPLHHVSAVTGAVFKPMQIQLATAAWNGDLRLWNAETGKLLHAPIPNAGSITSIAFSPDGLWFAAASTLNSATIWNVQTAEKHREIIHHQGEVRSIAFSPDSASIATGSIDKTVCVWDVRTGAHLGSTMRHDRPVLSVAFNADGSQLATACGDKRIRFWDVRHPISNRHTLALYDRVVKTPDRAIANDREFQSELDAMLVKQRFLYHQTTVKKAIREKNWFTASFHLRWLLDKQPQNANWWSMLNQANAKLSTELISTHP